MAGEDRAYADWVRTLPCMMRRSGGCSGPIEAHHAGFDRGRGQKAHDRTCVPLCLAHHRAWHDVKGVFAKLTEGLSVLEARAKRREWAAAAIERVQAGWERRQQRLVGGAA